MGRKVLQDHAYVFCQMFMGWRMQQDLGTFSNLPDGELHINVLTGTCNHSANGKIGTYIADEIKCWFANRLETHQIPAGEIESAELFVTMKNTMPAKHKMGITFDWTCDSRISTTDGREYSAHLAEPHTWIPMRSQNENAE